MQPKTPTVKWPGAGFTGDVHFNEYYAGEYPRRGRVSAS